LILKTEADNFGVNLIGCERFGIGNSVYGQIRPAVEIIAGIFNINSFLIVNGQIFSVDIDHVGDGNGSQQLAGWAYAIQFIFMSGVVMRPKLAGSGYGKP